MSQISNERSKVLIVASVVSFIEWFNKENVEYLKNDLGCEVHICCNFDYMQDTSVERTNRYKRRLIDEGFVLYNVAFPRNPFCLNNLRAYDQLKKIIDKGDFDLIHCHTPNASILTRIAARRARKNGTVVMYTCHGFHFHNASFKKNWLIYYPIERFCSRFCDYLVTINKEDFNRAKSFHCRNVRYIPGVGVDIRKFSEAQVDRQSYKEQLGIPQDAVVAVSIGELIERKNHETIIRAIARLRNKNLYYLICGKGELLERLEKMAEKLGIGSQVKFLGFREDVPQLCKLADFGVFPSKIEGLGLAGIEIMAAGVPLISSNVHGILDYVLEGKTGYACKPTDVNGFAKAIDKMVSNPNIRQEMQNNCLKAVEPFDVSKALETMWTIYREALQNRSETATV